jgi:hypothetical protein
VHPDVGYLTNLERAQELDELRELVRRMPDGEDLGHAVTPPVTATDEPPPGRCDTDASGQEDDDDPAGAQTSTRLMSFVPMQGSLIT